MRRAAEKVQQRLNVRGRVRWTKCEKIEKEDEPCIMHTGGDDRKCAVGAADVLSFRIQDDFRAAFQYRYRLDHGLASCAVGVSHEALAS